MLLSQGFPQFVIYLQELTIVQPKKAFLSFQTFMNIFLLWYTKGEFFRKQLFSENNFGPVQWQIIGEARRAQPTPNFEVKMGEG